MNTLLLEDLNKEIDIKSSSVINGINIKKDIDLKINILKNNALIINIFSNASNRNINLDINLEKDSKLILNISFISKKSINLNVNTRILESKANAKVNVRGINELNSVTNIIMDGIIHKDTCDVILNEYAKVMNLSDTSSVKIVPNLIVDSLEAEANHGAAISDIEIDSIKYLMSKGIKEIDARELLKKSFILEIMDDESKDLIKKTLNGGI